MEFTNNILELFLLIPAIIEKYSPEERMSFAGVLIDSVAADRKISIEQVYEEMITAGQRVREECGEMELVRHSNI